MAGLTDMEELIGRVKDARYADYLREAMACYGVGAHRACIVLVFITVFEDLRAKTKALAPVSAKAKVISIDIESLAAGQKPFESQLVDRLTSETLITVLQSQKLRQIIDHRNKAAHPSGFIASAEEARFVFFESVDKFLSQEILSTTHAVDSILTEFTSPNYFPSNTIEELRNIVNAAMSPVHSSASEYLVTKLVSLLKDGDSEVSRNAKLFLLGLTADPREAFRDVIYTKLIRAKSVDTAFSLEIVSAISIDPTLFSMSDATTKIRCVKLFESLPSSTDENTAITIVSHPAHLLGSLLRHLTDSQAFPILSGFARAVIEKYWSSPGLIANITGSQHSMRMAVEIFVTKAGSYTFDTANKFASALPEMDKILGAAISGEQAFALLYAVHTAAENGAWTSSSLRGGRFNAVPVIASKALEYVKGHPAKLHEALGIENLEVASKFAEEHLLPHPADASYS